MSKRKIDASTAELAAKFKGMHVLSTTQFDETMLRFVFETASAMKRMVAEKGKSDVLRGRILANVFFEPSPRTMCSVDAAMKRLGGDVISVAESTSSAKKGETIEDTVRCLECYCDVLVLRHPVVGTAAKAAAAMSKPLLNAGDGTGEHPTQALLDLFTVVSSHKRAQLPAGIESGVDLSALTLTLLGDLKHGRTVHSLAKLAARLERPPKVALISPASLKMPPAICEEPSKGVTLKASLAEAIAYADVLYVTRVQKERFETPERTRPSRAARRRRRHHVAYQEGHALATAAAWTRSRSKSMPTAPSFEQMENGMYVRMALLALACGADHSQL